MKRTRSCFNLQSNKTSDMAKQVTFHVFREIIYLDSQPIYKNILWWSPIELRSILYAFKLEAARVSNEHPDLDMRTAINITVFV
uniref:Uncharacterized protein n=1 Tax=viral metagenome TaxID=1070528 RepID=A0A6C0LM96_9ZZZZ